MTMFLQQAPTVICNVGKTAILQLSCSHVAFCSFSILHFVFLNKLGPCVTALKLVVGFLFTHAYSPGERQVVLLQSPVKQSINKQEEILKKQNPAI